LDKRFPDWGYILNLKGIGKETIDDLKGTYPNVEALINAFLQGEHIPVRNDQVKILKRGLNEWAK